MSLRNIDPLGWAILITTFIATLLFATWNNTVYANQMGVTFSEDAIGALGDYQKSIGAWEFESDAQLQRSETLSLSANAAIQRNFGSVGIKPFAAYSRDDIGNILDAGGVLNFSLGGLDIAGGASFRGADPAGSSLETRFDENDTEVQVHPEGYSPNAYQLPAVNNINAVFHTGFEFSKIETDLTGYVPITEREQVPVVLISRSQTSIKLTDAISASVVLDARTYLHSDGVEVQFKPIGSITYRF